MTYKNYQGSITFDDEAEIFHGDVINTTDVITFQGTSVRELKKAFKESEDEYLAFCAEKSKQPERPFSGNLVIRIDPELHKKLACIARRFSTAMAHHLDRRRKFENRDLAVVHHSVARDSRISYVYPSASPSRYENL